MTDAVASGRRGWTRGMLLVLFLALTVLVINASQWFVLARVRESLEEETGLRLVAVATAAVGEATEELLLRPDAEDDEFLLGTLRDIADRSDLDDIFVLDVEGAPILDLAGPADASGPFVVVDDATFAAALGGAAAASPTRRVNDVVFKTAYAPVRYADGTVGAVLGVAAGGGFLARLPAVRRTLRFVSLGSAALVVLLGAAFFGMSRRLAATERALSRSESLSAMGMMAAGVAHEVRNPLSIISGTAQRLRKKYGAGVEDPLFDFIPEEVERLNGIVEGYLRFARNEALSTVDTDLVRVVDRSTELVAQEWGARQVRFARTGWSEPLPIRADPQRLTQVLLNLLINAAQAMPNGGEVVVHVDRDEGQAILRVGDTGPGFDPRALRDAFEPFFTTKDQGSGLGLAMAKRIVEGHGGTIAVGNRASGGGEVSVRLPLLGPEGSA